MPVARRLVEMARLGDITSGYFMTYVSERMTMKPMRWVDAVMPSTENGMVGWEQQRGGGLSRCSARDRLGGLG